MKISFLSLLLFFTISINAQQCWKMVSLGADFCVALKQDGTLWAWGHNESGQLGVGSFEDMLLPTKVGMESDWESISAGYGFVVALKTNGTIWVWGRNDFGLGMEPNSIINTPAQVGTDSDWKYVHAGGAHSFAIKNDGTLWAWGRNDFGQLGIGLFNHSNVPVQVGNDSDWKAVAAGNLHSLGVKTDNSLWSWGYNFAGQLGLGTAGFGTEANIPTQIKTIPANQWKCVAAGGRHSLAVSEDGKLWVWGNNNFFALGLNDGSEYKSLPTLIDNTSNWKMVAGGINNTLAVKEDNTIWGWGENVDGQLGDGSNINRASPVQINIDAEWLFVDSGLQHSMFLNEVGILTTGRNNYGELGIGSLVEYNTPQSVICPINLGVAEHPELSFIAYPNPVAEVLFLRNINNIKIDEIQILNSTGRVVLKEKNEYSAIRVDQLQSGLYLLQILSEKHWYQIKFIKE